MTAKRDYDPQAKREWIAKAVMAVTDDCLDWPWGRQGGGYGAVHLDGVRRNVHAVVCEEAHGPRPPGHEAVHSCGRPGCANARHLRWATPTRRLKETTVRVCARCRAEKPLSDFARSSAQPLGRVHVCKQCVRGGLTKAERRARNLWQKHKITVDEFDAMLAQQGGRCALCGTDEPGGRFHVFHVDHCHETGRIRGLLCHCCNVGLGHLGDTEEKIMIALNYLKEKTK